MQCIYTDVLESYNCTELIMILLKPLYDVVVICKRHPFVILVVIFTFEIWMVVCRILKTIVIYSNKR